MSGRRLPVATLLADERSARGVLEVAWLNERLAPMDIVDSDSRVVKVEGAEAAGRASCRAVARIRRRPVAPSTLRLGPAASRQT